MLIDTLVCGGHKVIGLTSSEGATGKIVDGLEILGDDTYLDGLDVKSVLIAIGVGSVGCSSLRKRLFDSVVEKGYQVPAVIHPSAIISSQVSLANGAQIMAGVVLQPGVSIGENSIINSRSSLDHDVVVGKNTHIAPGVVCSGGVTIGDSSHLGTGSVVIQGVRIGSDSLVAAGAVVTKDVADGQKVKGIPASSY